MSTSFSQHTNSAEIPCNQVGTEVHAVSGISGNETVRRQIDPKRYKTRLCRHFFEKGACPFALNCAFAHGEHELRVLDENAMTCLTNKPDELNGSAAVMSNISLNNGMISGVHTACGGAMCAPTPCYPPVESTHTDYTAPHNSVCVCLNCQPYSTGASYSYAPPYQYDVHHGQYAAHHYNQPTNYPYAPSASENYGGYAHGYPYSSNNSNNMYPSGYNSAPYSYPPYYQQPQQTINAQGATTHTYTIDPYATYPIPQDTTVASGYSPYKPCTLSQSGHPDNVQVSKSTKASLP